MASGIFISSTVPTNSTYFTDYILRLSKPGFVDSSASKVATLVEIETRY